MKLEIYLRMDGITGSTKNYTYRDWAAVRSWHWGMSRTQQARNNSITEAVNMNRITIVKPLGIESPMLMTLFADRTIVPTAEINVARPVAKREAQQKYINITLEKILIKSIETGADVYESDLMETIVLCFSKVKYEYFHTEKVEQGGATSSPDTHLFTWDLSNRESA